MFSIKCFQRKSCLSFSCRKYQHQHRRRNFDFNFIVYFWKILEELFDFASSQDPPYWEMVLFVFKSLVRLDPMKFTMSEASCPIYLNPVRCKSSFKWNYSDKFLSSQNKQKMFQETWEESCVLKKEKVLARNFEVQSKKLIIQGEKYCIKLQKDSVFQYLLWLASWNLQAE